MEGAKEQPRHGLDACRPFRMPPTRRKVAHRKSYRIADVILVIVTAFCVASVLWGYGCAYQVGYGAAEHFFTEVRHGWRSASSWYDGVQRSPPSCASGGLLLDSR